MRHGTLTADFKMVHLNIYIQLIYVIVVDVWPIKPISRRTFSEPPSNNVRHELIR